MKTVLNNLIAEFSPYGTKRSYEWKEIAWIITGTSVLVYLLVRIDCVFYNYLTT
jgi:hypothetical protein